MDNMNLVFAMQNLKEQLLSSRVSTDKLSEEIHVANLLKLNEKNLISDEDLKIYLLNTTNYSKILKPKKNIKAKTFR